MEFLDQFWGWIAYAWDFVLNIDIHLFELVNQYGLWIYAILFIIVFCETGLVVTPFLPGDSLLFASGVVAGTGPVSFTPLTLPTVFRGVLSGARGGVLLIVCDVFMCRVCG